MPSEYKFCRYCGRELPQGRALNFCPHCGKRLSAPPTETVIPPVEAPAPEAPSAPIEPPIMEKPQPAPPAQPKADELNPAKESKTEKSPKHAKPAPEPKSRKVRAAKAEKPKPQKRGKGGVRVLIAMLILAALCVAAYFATPLGTTIEDLKTLQEIDTYLAANDISSAVDAVSCLNAPEKYTERINPVYYAAAIDNKDKNEYDKALEYFTHCAGYADAEEQIRACSYVLGVKAFVNKSYVEAVEYFTNAGDYNSSPDMLERSREMLVSDEEYGQKVNYEVVVNWGKYYGDYTDSISAIKVENEIIIQANTLYNYAFKVFSNIDGKETVYLDGIGNDSGILVAKLPISDIIDSEAQISIGFIYASHLSQYPLLHNSISTKSSLLT